jgi:hypothetical protein
MNDRNFEDMERTMGDVIFTFFETLYLWMTAYMSHLSISFSDFLFLFALSS